MIFGKQKTVAHWGVQDMSLVAVEWDAELKRFPRFASDRALAEVKQQGSAWPPSLSEFIRTCRQFNRPEHRIPDPKEKRLTHDTTPTSAEQARANLAKIRAMTGTTFKPMPTGKH